MLKKAEEKDRQLKQKFLFQEILEKNRDVEMFEKFLVWKKEAGDDINNWEMSGLKDAVREFKRHFPHAIDFNAIAEKSKKAYKNLASKTKNKKLNPGGVVSSNSIRVVDLANKRMRIFSGFSKKKGVERTVEELVWALQTFAEENPQVGVVDLQIERIFKTGEADQLVNHEEIKLEKLMRRIRESESEPVEKEKSGEESHEPENGNKRDEEEKSGEKVESEFESEEQENEEKR